MQCIGNYLYDTQKIIGQGTFCKVFYGYHISNPNIQVAIKKISHRRLKHISLENINNEIRIHQILNHPNIVRYYDSFEINHSIYIVTEFCNSQNLKSLIDQKKSFTESELKSILSQIKDSLQYMYDHDLVHRDIKPQNILIHKTFDNQIYLKLSDFNFSEFKYNLEKNTSVLGTPLYLDPDVILKRQHTVDDDLWSFGVLMYRMIYQTYPYGKIKNISELCEKYRTQSISFDPNIYSSECNSLLKSLLLKNNRRINWRDFFNHNWWKVAITQNSQDSIFQMEEDILDLDDSFEFRLNNLFKIKSPPEINIETHVIENYIQKDEKYKYNTQSVPIAIPTRLNKYTQKAYNILSDSLDHLKKYATN